MTTPNTTASPHRCLVTGNPCGTDTYQAGDWCRCFSCARYGCQVAGDPASPPKPWPQQLDESVDRVLGVASPPEQEGERCPTCRRPLGTNPPTSTGCCYVHIFKAQEGTYHSHRWDCLERGIAARDSDLATLQAKLDALVAERAHLEEAARLCRFCFKHAVENADCTDAEADAYGETFRAWIAAERAKAAPAPSPGEDKDRTGYNVGVEELVEHKKWRDSWRRTAEALEREKAEAHGEIARLKAVYAQTMADVAETARSWKAQLAETQTLLLAATNQRDEARADLTWERGWDLFRKAQMGAVVDAARDTVEAFTAGRVTSSTATLSRLRAALSALDASQPEPASERDATVARAGR